MLTRVTAMEAGVNEKDVQYFCVLSTCRIFNIDCCSYWLDNASPGWGVGGGVL